MKPINIVYQVRMSSHPNDLLSFMLCFTAKDNITPEEVSKTFNHELYKAIEHGKTTGQTNLIQLISVALKRTETSLLCESSFMMQVHGICGLELNNTGA